MNNYPPTLPPRHLSSTTAPPRDLATTGASVVTVGAILVGLVLVALICAIVSTRLGRHR